jgi:hypothetical protein
MFSMLAKCPFGSKVTDCPYFPKMKDCSPLGKGCPFFAKVTAHHVNDSLFAAMVASIIFLYLTDHNIDL